MTKKENELTTVSILTPTFNHAPWIGACIESVLAQTYQNWEMIILDDGSTDGTGEEIKPYLTDRRIQYIYQPNRGIWRLGENYNLALSHSRGQLIAILEGDDLWPPDKLEKQVPTFTDESVGISYGRGMVVDQTGESVQEDILRIVEWDPPYASFESESPIPFLRDLLMLRGNVGAVTLMFRKVYLDLVGGFHQDDGFPAVDFSTLLRVATVSRAVFVDHPLGIWRCHDGQTTQKHNLAYVLGHTKAAIDYFCSLSHEIKLVLDITEEDIQHARRAYLANAHWSAVRGSMSDHDWREVRKNAGQMLRWGSPFRKMEGIAAYLAGWLHIDLNPLVERVASTPWGGKLVR